MELYVKCGIAGYGPDLDVEDEPYIGVDDVCSAIQYELDHAIDALWQEADAHGEASEFEDAWKSVRLARDLENVCANFDPRRKDAPLYRHNSRLWHETVSRMIRETFPLDVDRAATRLYVWEVEE